MRNFLGRLLFTAAPLVCSTTISVATADPLPSNRNIDIKVSNDAGALYGSGPDDTYYINAPGGGLNQLHITTDSTPAGVSGQVTTQNITHLQRREHSGSRRPAAADITTTSSCCFHS